MEKTRKGLAAQLSFILIKISLRNAENKTLPRRGAGTTTASVTRAGRSRIGTVTGKKECSKVKGLDVESGAGGEHPSNCLIACQKIVQGGNSSGEPTICDPVKIRVREDEERGRCSRLGGVSAIAHEQSKMRNLARQNGSRGGGGRKHL